MYEEKPKVVLAIAGFDPSSGAGVIADLKTVAAHGLYGVGCITALTVQTTQGVLRSESVRPELVRETLEALVDDTPPSAVKIGMLGSADIAAVVAEFLRSSPQPNIVLDPVLRSSSGTTLLGEAGIELLRRELLVLADVVTPNLAEAGLLTGMAVHDSASMQESCLRLKDLGVRNTVVKGGHLPEPTDLLAQSQTDGTLRFRHFPGARIATMNTHGTGCAFSTALACRLACGANLEDAVLGAKEYVAQALRKSYSVGKGTGPVNHFFRLRHE